MQQTLWRFIWSGSKRSQLLIFALTLLALPFYYVSLELPKLIINDVIGAPSQPPHEWVFFGHTVMSMDVWGMLVVYCLAFLLAVIAQGAVKFVLNTYKARLGGQLLLKLRRDLCTRILQMPSGTFAHLSSDELSTMIGNELTEVGAFAGEAIATPLLQGGLFITAVVFIFAQDPWLGLAAMALFPVQFYLIPRLQKRVNRLNRDRVQAMRALAARLSEATDSLAQLQVSGDQQSHFSSLDRVLVTVFEIRYAIALRRSLIKLLNNVLFQLTPFLFLLIGGLLVMRGELTLGALVAVLAAYKDLPPPARDLLDYYQSVQDVRVQYEQVVSQFDKPNYRTVDLTIAGNTPPSITAVEVQGLQVRPDVGVLGKVPFELFPAIPVSVVTPSLGLAKMFAFGVAGLQAPSAGRVLINGNDAQNLKSIERHSLSFLTDQPMLFSGSLAENVSFATSEHSDSSDRIFEALQTTMTLEELAAIGLEAVLGDTPAEQALATQLLEARKRVSSSLTADGWVERFEDDQICLQLSLGNNLVWGKFQHDRLNFDDLGEFSPATRALKKTGLQSAFLELGLVVAASANSPDSQLPNKNGNRSALVYPDEEKAARTTCLHADRSRPGKLSMADQRFLYSLALRVIPAKHQHIEVPEVILFSLVSARKYFAEHLDARGRANFQALSEGAYIAGFNIRQNLMFGVPHDGEGTGKLDDVMIGLISDCDLLHAVARCALSFGIGYQGSRLSAANRQQVALARAVLREAPFSIMVHATDALSDEKKNVVVNAVLSKLASQRVLWFIEHPTLARHFAVSYNIESIPQDPEKSVL